MKFFSKLFSYIGSLFFQGFFAILPITLTIVFIHFAVNLTKKWFHPILQFLPKCFLIIPFVEFIIVFCFILLVGFILNYFFIAQLAQYIDRIIERIPLIKPIYVGMKQLVSAINTQEQGAFKEVVFVEFPRKGSYAVGFLTGRLPQELNPQTSLNYFSIFIPAAPNPTSGFVIIVPQHEFIIVDMSRQEAMKLIISGGIIMPDKFAKS
jgi:uncharacterized membrane protein